MKNITKLDTPAADCPICDAKETAAFYEEVEPIHLAETPPTETVGSVLMRYQICSACGSEFVAADDSRFNKEHVLAANARYGAVKLVCS